ncbi:MAG: hypothetical protein ABIV25_00295 [Paracoccaceae bacterium]
MTPQLEFSRHVALVHSGLAHAFAAFAFRFGEWRRRKLVLTAYGSLSEQGLRDIGLKAHDLVRAMDLPLSQDAARMLADAAAEEAGKW